MLSSGRTRWKSRYQKAKLIRKGTVCVLFTGVVVGLRRFVQPTCCQEWSWLKSKRGHTIKCCMALIFLLDLAGVENPEPGRKRALYGFHSPRIGGTQCALVAGMEREVVRILGRWA